MKHLIPITIIFTFLISCNTFKEKVAIPVKYYYDYRFDITDTSFNQIKSLDSIYKYDKSFRTSKGKSNEFHMMFTSAFKDNNVKIKDDKEFLFNEAITTNW